MTPAEYAKERKSLTSTLKKEIKPFLRPSGFVTEDKGCKRKHLEIWVPRGRKGDATFKAYKLPRGFVIQEFLGFCEHGVITDCYGGGLATAEWENLPLEDLFRLVNWAQRMMPKFAKVAVQESAEP